MLMKIDNFQLISLYMSASEICPKNNLFNKYLFFLKNINKDQRVRNDYPLLIQKLQSISFEKVRKQRKSG